MTRNRLAVSTFVTLFSLASPIPAHCPVSGCADSGVNAVTCEGGVSNGISAAS